MRLLGRLCEKGRLAGAELEAVERTDAGTIDRLLDRRLARHVHGEGGRVFGVEATGWGRLAWAMYGEDREGPDGA